MAATLQVESVQPKLHWGRLLGLFLVHVAMAAGLVGVIASVVLMVVNQQFEWAQIAVGLVAYPVLAFGVTVYLHRYRTHGAFQFRSNWAGNVAAVLLNIAALAALQGEALRWVFWHRRHHRHSDGKDDLHSPSHGWLWAHIGWLLSAPNPDTAALEELRQPLAVDRFLDTYMGMVIYGPGLALGFSYLAAGWMGMVWYLAAACCAWHITAGINSRCHRAPRTKDDKPNPDTGDYSRNSVVLGILGFGEGWHRDHHRHLKSARIGQRWWRIDKGYYFIRFLQLCRAATNVRVS